MMSTVLPNQTRGNHYEGHVGSIPVQNKPHSVLVRESNFDTMESSNPYLPDPFYPLSVQCYERFASHREETFWWMLQVGVSSTSNLL